MFVLDDIRMDIEWCLLVYWHVMGDARDVMGYNKTRSELAV